MCRHEPAAEEKAMVPMKTRCVEIVRWVMTSLTQINNMNPNRGRSWSSYMDMIFVLQKAPLHCIVMPLRKELRRIKLVSFVLVHSFDNLFCQEACY
jgi:hypothetical protein